MDPAKAAADLREVADEKDREAEKRFAKAKRSSGVEGDLHRGWGMGHRRTAELLRGLADGIEENKSIRGVVKGI